MTKQYSTYLFSDINAPNKMVGWRSAAHGNQPYLVTGPYKMMSLFIRTLLTDKGAIIGRPDEGTDFNELITSGQVANDLDVQVKLLEILDDCFQQVQNLQQKISEKSSMEKDEVLLSYNLDNLYVSSDGGAVSVTVSLTNAAGQKVSGLLPISNRI